MDNVTAAKLLCFFSKVTYKVTYKTCIGLNHTAFNQIENT